MTNTLGKLFKEWNVSVGQWLAGQSSSPHGGQGAEKETACPRCLSSFSPWTPLGWMTLPTLRVGFHSSWRHPVGYMTSLALLTSQAHLNPIKTVTQALKIRHISVGSIKQRSGHMASLCVVCHAKQNNDTHLWVIYSAESQSQFCFCFNGQMF